MACTSEWTDSFGYWRKRLVSAHQWSVRISHVQTTKKAYANNRTREAAEIVSSAAFLCCWKWQLFLPPNSKYLAHERFQGAMETPRAAGLPKRRRGSK